MKVLLIIPAYNEEKSILNVYNSIINYNKKNKTNYDVIVINDGSKDNTSQVCHTNNIPVIDLVMNLGIGGAVQTGYKYALENDYDIAIQFDGDGQHDINYVDDLIKPIINNNVNMTIGSRFVKKGVSSFISSFARRIGIRIISDIIKLRTKKRIYDTTSGYRAVDKNVINLFAKKYPLEYPEPISTAKLIAKGMKVEEVPVAMKERETGKSSIHTYKSVYYMINVILSLILINRRGE